MRQLLIIALALSMLLSCGGAPPRPPAGSQAATEPRSTRAVSNPVADAINKYRQDRGLGRLAVSPLLTRVAEAHVADLEANHRRGGRCNMHSWSGNGKWSACCYTPDHTQAACMWDKPRELSGGAYASPGYEIVAHYTDPISPSMALQIWRESPAHHAMIINSGRWADNTWRAMGAAVGRHYAVVWFGEAADPSAR
jgi:uncharacterized protein YkwD